MGSIRQSHPIGKTSRQTSAGSGAQGHAAKTKNVKPKKAKNAANQSALARSGAFGSHGNSAEKSNGARAVGARLHQAAKLKPKRLSLPGPIGEHPARRHGKKK